MAELLISFCNVRQFTAKRNRRWLLLLDTKSKQTKWVKIPDLGDSVLGATGILRRDSDILVALHHKDGVSSILQLDKTLTAARHDFFDSVKDVHSLAVDGDTVITTSTATDSLVRFRFDGSIREERLVHAFSNGSQDSLHVNSVALTSSYGLVVSMFGTRPEGGWQTARAGQVTTLTGEVLVSDLRHPHSLATAGTGSVCFVESLSGTLFRVDDKGLIYRVDVGRDGYVRGLATSADTAYVGVNVARDRSKSTGLLVGKLFALGHSYICRLDISSGKHEGNFELTGLGDEIYDIAVL